MMRTLKDKYCTFNVLLNVCWWIFSLIRPLKNNIVHKLFAELHERYQKAKPFIIIAWEHLQLKLLLLTVIIIPEIYPTLKTVY